MEKLSVGRLLGAGISAGTTLAVAAGLLVHMPLHAATDTVITASTHAASQAGMQFSETTPFAQVGSSLSSPAGATVAGNLVKLGEGYPRITVPAHQDAVFRVGGDGSAVHFNSATDLGIRVESGADGPARVLTVAGAAFSDSAQHRYEYQVGGNFSQLVQSESGTVYLLDKEFASTLNHEFVDLTTVLPEDDGDYDYTVYDESPDSDEIASEEELEGEFVAPSGWTINTAFQEPWAVDASGERLNSWYEVSGNTLVQVVDTTGATFPVTSDPLPLVAIGLAAVARALISAVLPKGAKALATQTIRAGSSATTRGGYKTFNAFKKDLSKSAPKNNQWHHIVEQGNIKARGWNARHIHNRNNPISIPKAVHQKCINSWMAKKNVSKFGIKSGNKTMRSVVRGKSFSQQHRIGVQLLKHCGVKV